LRLGMMTPLANIRPFFFTGEGQQQKSFGVCWLTFAWDKPQLGNLPTGRQVHQKMQWVSPSPLQDKRSLYVFFHFGFFHHFLRLLPPKEVPHS